jgi:hypothetical protein
MINSQVMINNRNAFSEMDAKIFGPEEDLDTWELRAGDEDFEGAPFIATLHRLMEDGDVNEARGYYERYKQHYEAFMNENKEATRANLLKRFDAANYGGVPYEDGEDRLSKLAFYQDPNQKADELRNLIKMYVETSLKKEFERRDSENNPMLSKHATASSLYGKDIADNLFPEIKAKLEREQKVIAANKANGGLVTRDSMPVFHNGGIVNKTGPVFAQKGEIIYPKHFALGSNGPVVANNASEAICGYLAANSMNSGKITVEIDTSKLESLLSGATISVDTSRPVPVDISKPVPIDTSMTVSIDTGNIANEIKLAIESAKINIDTVGGEKSVGADKIDDITRLLEAHDSRISDVELGFDGQIQMLNNITSGMKEINISGIIDDAIERAVAPVISRIDTVENDISHLTSSVNATNANFNTRIGEFGNEISRVKNFAMR